MENIHKILSKSKIVCGSEVWGLIKAGKELYNVHNRLFSKLTDTIRNCVANGFAEIELGRQSRKGKCIAQVVKFWYLVVSGHRRFGKTILWISCVRILTKVGLSC